MCEQQNPIQLDGRRRCPQPACQPPTVYILVCCETNRLTPWLPPHQLRLQARAVPPAEKATQLRPRRAICRPRCCLPPCQALPPRAHAPHALHARSNRREQALKQMRKLARKCCEADNCRRPQQAVPVPFLQNPTAHSLQARRHCTCHCRCILYAISAPPHQEV